MSVQLPCSIACFGVFHSTSMECGCRSNLWTAHRIACGPRDVARCREDGIGGKRGRDEREANASQGDDDKRSQANHKVLVALKKLVFCPTVKRVWQPGTEVGFAAPKRESCRVNHFMQRQDENIAHNVDYQPEEQSPASYACNAGVSLPGVCSKGE